MTNVLLFPYLTQPAPDGASDADPARIAAASCATWGRSPSGRSGSTDSSRELRAGLIGVIGLLEAALREINPLLETIEDPWDRQKLARRIAIANLDVERAKYNVARLIDNASR